MQPSQQPQGPAGGGAPPAGAGGPDAGGGDPGAQIQQIAQQYVAQGRPPELAQQGFDMVVSAMGLDQQAPPQGGAGAPGGAPAGGPPAGGDGGQGGAPTGPPSMRNGGKFQSKSKKQEAAAATSKLGAGAPVLKIPGK